MKKPKRKKKLTFIEGGALLVLLIALIAAISLAIQKFIMWATGSDISATGALVLILIFILGGIALEGETI